MTRIIQRLRELEAQAAATDHGDADHGHVDHDLAPLAAPPPLEIPALDADHPSADLLEQTHIPRPTDKPESAG
jgi:hypothetical protein